MPTALVTGATAGIGAAFARALAQRRYDLVLVARDTARLQAAATELTGRFGVSVETIAADLTDPAERATVEARLGDTSQPVGLLVNNAGYGTIGDFWSAPVEGEEGQVLLHVLATLRLTHAALSGMVARREGAVVNVASTAGLMPGASGPTYGATKAFQAFFSEALAVQLRGQGVRVMALCPGFTRTEFHQRAGIATAGIADRLWLDADTLVDGALADHRRRRPISVPGWQYKALTEVGRLTPRPLLSAASRAVKARRGRK